MKADFRPQAEKAVRHTLVIDEVTKVENITANEEEIDEYLTEIAKSYQMELEAFKGIVNAQGMLPQMMSEVNSKKP
jgi:trigger factor